MKKSTDRQYLLLHDSQVVVASADKSALFWSHEQAQPFTDGERGCAAGVFQGSECWAYSLDEKSLASIIAAGGEVLTLRSLLDWDEQLFALVGRAVQLLSSYVSHRFCGHCGSATVAVAGEHAMQCLPCQRFYYPRLSPCAIMLVSKGEYCLLARHGGRAGDYFTCLAGYVEPGETVEQTVCREVREEVSVCVNQLRYFGSQCWPFPGQLMLGFHAEYESGTIEPDGVEIVEADWFHYSQLPPHPGGNTLSGQLIKAFVARHTE